MSDKWMEFTDEFTGETCFPYYDNISRIIQNGDFLVLRMFNGKSYKLRKDGYTAQHHHEFIAKKLQSQDNWLL